MMLTRRMAVLAAAVLGLVALAAVPGARADCSAAETWFNGPTVALAQAKRAEMRAAVAACLGDGAEEGAEEFEAVAPDMPTGLFASAWSPVGAAYDGEASLVPTHNAPDRRSLWLRSGVTMRLDFGDEGAVSAFGFDAYDSNNQVTVTCEPVGGGAAASFAVFSPGFLLLADDSTAFWGFYRGADEAPCRAVTVTQAGPSDLWQLDSFVAFRAAPAACATPCINGGADSDCDGVCEGCSGGWTGDLCDECPASCEHGSVNADCQCACDGSWSGDSCDECATVCENDGVDSDCDGVCECPNSWSGAACDECATACENGGVDSDCDGVCECSGSWSGDSCGECATVCENDGVDSDCDGVCECPNSWSGDACDECATACENGGADSDCDGVCECLNGWSGDSCGECATVCENDGVDSDCDGVCECPNSWSGAACDECATACENGGVDSDCDGVCECPNNWSGDSCGECATVCASGGTDSDCDGVCEGAGVCPGDLSRPDGTGDCRCPDGLEQFGVACVEMPGTIPDPGTCTATVGAAGASNVVHASSSTCAGIVWTSCDA